MNISTPTSSLRRAAPTWARDAERPEVMVEEIRGLVGRNITRWRWLLVLEAGGLAIAGPLGYLWAIFLLDNALHLSVVGRVLAAVGFAVTVVLLGARLVRRLRTLALTEDEVALAIERLTPGGVQNRLINALQIARAAGSAAPAVVRENFANLRQTDLATAAPSRPALVRVALAVLLVGAGLAFWALRPDHFANAASRIFMPMAGIEPLYRTRLVVEPGDVEAEGDVTMRIRIQGERPGVLHVTRQSGGQRLNEAIAVPAGADEIPYTFFAVRQSLTYSVQGGDFTTRLFRIDVPATVRLSLVRAKLSHPEYTGKGTTIGESAGGDLEALRGTTAELTFVFDHPVTQAAMLVERLVPKDADDERTFVQKVDLTPQSATEYSGSFLFQDAIGYELEVRQGERAPEYLGPFAVRVLADQDPRLELSGLDQAAELSADAAVPLRISVSDDLGLEKVGLAVRRPRDTAVWQSVSTWPVERKSEFARTHQLLLTDLGAAEGDAFELAVRAVDTDPLKKGAWITGTPHKLIVGGDGVALQRQYEQIIRSQAEIKALLAAQTGLAEKTIAELQKLDLANGKPAGDPKVLQTTVANLVKAQTDLRQTASQAARDMPEAAGNLRLAVGMLADTEMIRAIRILETVPGRDGPQAQRAALADARLTQERTARSLQEIGEQYTSFRQEWELAHMIAFVEMLAERQGRLRDQSRRHAASPPAEVLCTSMQKRQAKLLAVVLLAQPAFVGLADRTRLVEPILGNAFADAATTLAATTLHGTMTQAGDAAKAGRWAEAADQQDLAAKELAELFARLKEAQTAAALKALESLKEKAKSDAEAQKELEKLKAGTTDKFINIKDKMKLEDIVHMREAGAGKKGGTETNPPPNDYLFPESAKSILSPPDTGKRQQFDILKLAESPTKTPSFPKQSDRTANAIANPPIQEKFDDLVGKLLEEADEIQKKFETYNLNAAFNINEPGEIGKQGGDLNSTAAAAATGNMKPPTVNVGGASRAGRRGARAHGMVVGDESINRRGRDKVQEGQEKASDQAGTIREKKSDDMQKDTSTGIGGKKVEGDDQVKFSVEDAGKWEDDIAKRLGKPQAKNFIVERQDGRLDPRVAEMLRDLTSRQEQLIERVKSLRKELRNLYLPTDHLDELLAQMTSQLEAMKEQPDPELFRLQGQALDQLRNTVRVFQGPTSGFQPSLPRDRALHGRVLDEPARATLPGYEEAVKQYYEKLSVR